MRNAITFLECRVQGEFHHDNLLRWVLLVEDMKERERVTKPLLHHLLYPSLSMPPYIYGLFYLKLLLHHLTHFLLLQYSTFV